MQEFLEAGEERDFPDSNFPGKTITEWLSLITVDAKVDSTQSRNAKIMCIYRCRS